MDKALLQGIEGADAATEEERMSTLIDLLSSYVERFHDGAIEMVSFDGKILKIRLLGACVGCALANGTIHGWVEGNVRQFFPLLERVEAV
jgi:Fe-S cluster biogenesis protein NfuA